MEKKYMAFDTARGCMVAGVGLLVATAGLLFSFFWLPKTIWLQLPLAVITYAIVLRFAFQVDKRSTNSGKRFDKKAD